MIRVATSRFAWMQRNDKSIRICYGFGMNMRDVDLFHAITPSGGASHAAKLPRVSQSATHVRPLQAT